MCNIPIPRRQNYAVLRIQFQPLREVKFDFDIFEFIILFYSYDGTVFHNHQNSKNDHALTTLANFNESPFAVGDYYVEHSKAEIFNIATNTWTEVDDYPFHPE